MSHLLQMRGLKQARILVLHNEAIVASFTDAWIETLITAFCSLLTFVASFTDAWIETVFTDDKAERNEGRIFYRCVD